MSKQTWPLLQEQAHRIFRTNLIGTAQQGMIHGSRDMLWGDMLSRCAGLPTCAPDIIYNMGSMQERGTGIIVGGGDNTPVDVGVHWAGLQEQYFWRFKRVPIRERHPDPAAVQQ